MLHWLPNYAFDYAQIMLLIMPDYALIMPDYALIMPDYAMVPRLRFAQWLRNFARLRNFASLVATSLRCWSKTKHAKHGSEAKRSGSDCCTSTFCVACPRCSYVGLSRWHFHFSLRSSTPVMFDLLCF